MPLIAFDVWLQAEKAKEKEERLPQELNISQRRFSPEYYFGLCCNLSMLCNLLSGFL